MADFEQAGKDIARSLDSSDRDEASRSLSQYAQSLSRDDFKKLVKSVDKHEKDGTGLDLVIKYDGNGDPIHFSILNKEMHAKAKEMATLMDSGKTADAAELLQQTAAQIDREHRGDPDKVQRDFSLWTMAVDAYERDGQGSDVSIDTRKPGVSGIEWKFERR